MIVLDARTQQDVNRSVQALTQVQAEVTGSGMESIMTLAVLQMSRFVAGHIEVDTGRTKNSVFEQVRGAGNGVEGVLGTNVHYAPYVLHRNRGRQFFEYAADVEGLNVAQLFGEEVQIRVEKAGS